MDPFRDFWRARAEYLESRAVEHEATIAALKAEVARLKGPPLWRRVYQSKFVQTLEAFALLLLAWLLEAALLAICLYVLLLVCIAVLYGATATIVMTTQVFLPPPEPPLHRLYYDADVVGAVYPSPSN